MRSKCCDDCEHSVGLGRLGPWKIVRDSKVIKERKRVYLVRRPISPFYVLADRQCNNTLSVLWRGLAIACKLFSAHKRAWFLPDLSLFWRTEPQANIGCAVVLVFRPDRSHWPGRSWSVRWPVANAFHNPEQREGFNQTNSTRMPYLLSCPSLSLFSLRISQ